MKTKGEIERKIENFKKKILVIKDVLKTEKALMKIIPENRWSKTHHVLIFHGRNCCAARKPACEECPVSKLCEKNL